MIIAVNTRFLPDNYPSVYRCFIYETFKLITGNNPEHEFIFISDRKYIHPFVIGSNVKQVITGPPVRHPLLLKFWFDIKIPALLRKYQADVFVSCDGICSLTTKVPQCLVLQGLDFLQHPSFLKKSYLPFYKKYTAKFLSKAKSIVTVSEFLKQAIVTQYNTDVSSIDVIFNAVNEKFQPINNEEKLIIKTKYSEGKEYFVYAGAIHPANNLLNLLKAFSVFKKRQQTSMKLVLAGKLALTYQSFKENLKSYKYRNDVVVIHDVEENELIKIIGAAYGLINPSLYKGFASSVLEAMRCDVPVITAAGSSMQEITEDAALYVDANSHTDIADKMMLLYKDENLRKELIQKGQPVVNRYSWNKTADLLWQSILRACK
jgi:glycosyltransferase involved in cell wall biosynthesis